MGSASEIESLSFDAAMAMLAQDYSRVVKAERVPLSESLGRVLAEDVVAVAPVPAHASSAMDGYAFRHCDFRLDAFPDGWANIRLPIQGRVTAGHPLQECLLPGHAVRILTGGMLPPGADTVAMQEDCLAEEGEVQLPPGLPRGANCRPAGDDITAGARVLTAGARLRPQDIGIAASVDRETLRVRRRLRVGLATTGDELRAPGEELPAGCVRDSNRHTIGAAIRSLGAEVTDYGIVGDHRELVEATLSRAAAENDMVISTGGVSEGDEDHVRPAVEAIGRLAFWKLPMKPGRPVAVGEVRDTPFVGLPGNPVSVMVSFWLVARPLLLRLAGATDLDVPRFPVQADFEHRHKPGRREFLRGRIEVDPAGTPRAQVYRSASSGMLSSLSWSTGLVEILEHEGDVGIGDHVRFIPYSALLS